MKKSINNLSFLFLILLFVGYVIFSYRSIFFTRYDDSYLRNLYDHSQWNMAISKRPVSDNIVYQVTGYDLIKNWNYFTIDPQTPVLGKYLYGYSILLFHNAEIAGIFLWISALFFFCLLAKIINKDEKINRFSLVLFLFSPLIFSQASQSMLDLPQLLMLLFHMIAVIKIKNHQKKKTLAWTLLAGLALGGFISLKIGFFAAAIIIADAVYLNQKKIVYLLLILATAGLTYFASYLPYFIQGHTIIEFLKNQKWIIFSYWLNSKIKTFPGMIIPALFSGNIKGWYAGSVWERVKEWTILWPIYGIFFLYNLKKGLRQLNTEIGYLTTLILAFFTIYFFIPFNARYLILILPLLILFSSQYIVKIKKPLMTILVIVFAFQLFFFIHPSPNDTVKTVESIWKNGAYQDLYSFLDQKTKEKINRYDFWRKGQRFEKNMNIIDKSVVILLPNNYFCHNTVEGNLIINYSTKLGKISNKKKIIFFRENNTWRIAWEDELFLKDFSFRDKIVTVTEPSIFGRLISIDGKIISEGQSWPVFYLTHNRIKDEAVVIAQLTKLTGLKKHDIEYIYKANWQSDWPAEIGPLDEKLSPASLEKTKLDPSITVKYRTMRIKNRDVVQNYPLLDPVLGGQISVIKPDGQRKIIIKRKKIDGIDQTYEKSI